MDESPPIYNVQIYVGNVERFYTPKNFGNFIRGLPDKQMIFPNEFEISNSYILGLNNSPIFLFYSYEKLLSPPVKVYAFGTSKENLSEVEKIVLGAAEEFENKEKNSKD